jgi:hypothetical protein
VLRVSHPLAVRIINGIAHVDAHGPPLLLLLHSDRVGRRTGRLSRPFAFAFPLSRLSLRHRLADCSTRSPRSMSRRSTRSSVKGATATPMGDSHADHPPAIISADGAARSDAQPAAAAAADSSRRSTHAAAVRAAAKIHMSSQVRSAGRHWQLNRGEK